MASCKQINLLYKCAWLRIDCIRPKVPKYQNTKIVEYRNSTGNNILDCGTFKFSGTFASNRNFGFAVLLFPTVLLIES